MRKLTEKQRIIYNAIKEYINKNGFSPSVRDLCKLTEKSSSATIYNMLQRLKKKGYINFIEGTTRSITIKELSEEHTKTQNEIAKEIGINKSYLSEILNGKKGCSALVKEKILKYYPDLEFSLFNPRYKLKRK